MFTISRCKEILGQGQSDEDIVEARYTLYQLANLLIKKKSTMVAHRGLEPLF